MKACVSISTEIEVGVGPSNQETVDQLILSLGNSSDQEVGEVGRSEAKVSPALGEGPHYVHMPRLHSS